MPTPRKLTADEVTFTLDILPEEMAPEDCLELEEDVERIRKSLRNGNEYAWFCAKVTAVWGNFSDSDYLGACSYRDEAEFRADAYFAAMKTEALRALNTKIAAAYDSISGLIG